MTIFFLLFILLPCIPMLVHSRRILHEPFFAVDSSESPSSSSSQPQNPTIPVSSSTLNQQYSFFPSYPSPPPPPPPPPPPSLSTNFSSFISLPTHKSKHRSRRLVAVIVVFVLLSSVLIIAAAMFFYSRRQIQRSLVRGFDNNPSLFHVTSSQFVYWVFTINPTRNHAGNNGGGGSPAHDQLASPEVHPLPQLPRSQNTGNIELGFRQNSFRHGSSSREVIENSLVKINDLSSSYPSPSSSPTHSISIILPSPLNSTPRSLIPISPESVASKPPFPSKRKSPSTMPPPSSPKRKIRRLYNPTTELPPKSETVETSEETSPQPAKTLKPSQWDELRASSDHENELGQKESSSSYTLKEEKFVENTSNSNSEETTDRQPSDRPSPNQVNRILDPKKSQGVANLLRVHKVTREEVCEALLDGNANALAIEIFESLLKFAPTKEEQRKLRLYCRDDSPIKLCPAERFLKALLAVPFAFKRVEVLLYIANFHTQVEFLSKSFETVKAAYKELRDSGTFLNLLDAVLKAGSRKNAGTNRGDARACKLDTLLNFVNVKELLHMAIQDIGSHLCPLMAVNFDSKCKTLGLQAVSGLSSELTNVKKVSTMDSNVLSSYVSELSGGFENVEDVIRWNETMCLAQKSQKFSDSLNGFKQKAKEEIARIQVQESDALSLVKEIIGHFNGNPAKEEAHPFRIFIVVRGFLAILDQVCKEI